MGRSQFCKLGINSSQKESASEAIQGLKITQRETHFLEYRMQRQVTTYICLEQVSHVFMLGLNKAIQCTVLTTGSQYTITQLSICRIPSLSFSCTKLLAIKLLKNLSFVAMFSNFSLAHKNNTFNKTFFLVFLQKADVLHKVYNASDMYCFM